MSTSKHAQTSLYSTIKTVYKWPRNLWFNRPECVIKCQQLSVLKNMLPPQRKGAERKVCSLHPHSTYTLLEHPENSPKHFYRCLSLASLHSLVSQTISFSSVDKLPSDKMHTDKILRGPQVVISTLFFSEMSNIFLFNFLFEYRSNACIMMYAYHHWYVYLLFLEYIWLLSLLCPEYGICKLESRKLLRKDTLIWTEEKAICPL